MKNIVLLIRSYNRPKYLESTLKSVLSSDIDICTKRYIYDDGSNDTNTNHLLSNNDYINVKGKEFIVVKGNTNKGCTISYVDALNYIKNDNNDEELLICTIDNDVVVKPNFISILMNEYTKAYNKYNTLNLLLTGFNPTNAHLNILENNGSYYRKESCGGVNFVFHIKFIDLIIKQWGIKEDWGVIYEMRKHNMPICCLTNSVINHIGYHGLNSFGNPDLDAKFKL